MLYTQKNCPLENVGRKFISHVNQKQTSISTAVSRAHSTRDRLCSFFDSGSRPIVRTSVNWRAPVIRAESSEVAAGGSIRNTAIHQEMIRRVCCWQWRKFARKVVPPACRNLCCVYAQARLEALSRWPFCSSQSQSAANNWLSGVFRMAKKRVPRGAACRKLYCFEYFYTKAEAKSGNEAALNNLREGSLTLIKHSHTRRSRAIIHLVLKGTAHVGILGHRLLHISVTFSMLNLDSRWCSFAT